MATLIKILDNAKFYSKTILGEVTPSGYTISDASAAAYISAVEAADGAALEDPVKQAIDQFVVGCKSDGIWTALKSSCILAGARTLNGALVPLVGTTPTNFNFVSADYNRKTGLKGNGSTKYLGSNRNNNADPQNSKHLAVYFGENLSSSNFVNRVHLGAVLPSGLQTSASVISTDGMDGVVNSGRYRANGSTAAVVSNDLAAGMKAVLRSNSSNITVRQNSSSTTISSVSQTPEGASLFVFARSQSIPSYSNARLSYYSIGESLNLTLLDTRVSNLMTALNIAI